MDPTQQLYAPGASTYAPFIAQASQTYGVPSNILSALVQQESSFNPNAIGGAGEIGLTQITPSLAASMGLNQAQLLDPQTNINAGASYLASLFAKFNNWPQALQAYNAGPNAAATGSSAGAGYATSVLSLAAATGDQVDPTQLAGALGSSNANASAPASAPATGLINIPGAPGWLNSLLSWGASHLLTIGAIALAVILMAWAILSLFKEPAQSATVSKVVEHAPEVLAAA